MASDKDTNLEDHEKTVLADDKNDVLFEDVLKKIGGYGLAQVLLIAFGIMVEVTVCYATFFFVFEGANPGFVCEEQEPWVDTGEQEGSVPEPTAPPLNGSLDECPAKGYRCTNYTYEPDLTSIVTEWNFVCDKSYYPKLTTSIFFGGVLVGAMCGSLADYVGRKRCVLAAWTGLTIFQASVSLANSYSVYAVLRFITGVFTGTCACTANTLPMEYVGPKLRHIVAIRGGWRLGYLTLPWIAYAIRPWRYLAVACSASTLIFIPLSFFLIPESARWYIQRGKFDLAMKQVEWVARLNRGQAPDISMLKAIAETSGKTAEEPVKHNVLDLFANRKMATRTTTLMFAWFAIGVVAYGITSEMSALTGDIYLNLFLSGLFNLLVRLTTIYTMEKLGIALVYLRAIDSLFHGTVARFRFGRKVCYPLYAVLPTVMCFVITILDATGAMKEAVRTGLAVASFALLSGAWSVVYAYAQETYPTLLRNTSTSAVNTVTRIGGIIAPQVSYLKIFHRSIPYVIFGSLGVISLVTMFIVMPETKGRPLPEEMPVRTWGWGKRPQDKKKDDTENTRL